MSQPRFSMPKISSESAGSVANNPASQPRLLVNLIVGLSRINRLYIAVD